MAKNLICILVVVARFLISSIPAFAQNNLPDSLRLRIERSKGIEKAKAYYDATYFALRGNTQLAKELISASEKYAQQEKDLAIAAYAKLNRGLYYSALGVLDSAIFFLEEAKTLSIKSTDKQVLIRTCSSIGKAYVTIGKSEKALENLFMALNLLNSSPDKETEFKVRINIVWAYLELKRYQDCVDFGKLSLKFIEPKYEWMLPYMYNNMAVSYGALKKVDSTRYLVEKSIRIAEATQQYNVLANAHFILGNTYESVGSYDLAAKEYLKAKPYREKMGDAMVLVADQYVLADLYHKTGKYNEGIKAALEGLKLAEKNKITLKFEGVYLALAKNYEGLKDFKNASKYYNLLASIKDSIYQNATSTAIAEMQAKYEAEKKDRKISDLNKDNQLKAASLERNTILISALLMILVLSGLIFYLWRRKQLHKQEAVLQEQQMRMREAQISAVIDSQEKERTRFASDLHDGMGQLVSALQINVQSLKQNKNEFETRDELFGNSEQLLSEIHQEIRNIAFNLMPPVLVKEGLLPAVNELLRKVSKSGKIKCTLNSFEFEGRFAELAEISLYRIIQEFISNIIKYSSATKVSVAFTGYEGEVVLTIEDDGIGYDLDKFKVSEGNGWRNINSRLNLIKASIEFDIVKDRKNNTITISIPSTSLERSLIEIPANKNTNQ